jgi:phosphoglycolate phosphatase
MTRHIFLDFDGTLVDSSEGIHMAFTRACEEVGIKAPPLTEFRSCIGPPIQVLARQLVPEIESDRLEALRLRFRAEYDHKYYSQVQWHEGVIEGLKQLHAQADASLSIVTNKPTQPTNSLVADARIADLFASIIGIDFRVTLGEGKVFSSKKEAISYALSRTLCSREGAVYVGDTPSDQKASLECDVAFIAATYGFHLWLPHELEGTTAAGSFAGVMDCLKRMAGN